MVKKHSSYRLSDEGKQLLRLLAQKLGVSETAVLEMAVRKLAEREEVREERNVPGTTGEHRQDRPTR